LLLGGSAGRPGDHHQPCLRSPPPTITTKGSGFGAYEPVDVYFDVTDLCLAMANGAGSFSCTLKVPREAIPAIHWVTAVGRRLVAGAQKPFTVRTNWSQFHYGPQHQGFNPYENVLNPSNAEGLNQTWSYPTLGAIGTSSPAVANGLVYVGSTDHKLYALYASTGTLKWSYPTGGQINSSPAVANGLVYVGSADKKLYALYASTGAFKWSYPTGGQINSSPAVANGLVYVGSYDGKLYALDASTGAYKWSYPTGSYINSSPAVANGLVYVGSTDNKLYALYASTGAKKWSYTTGGQIWSTSPAVANGLVYVGSTDHNLYALNAKTGDYLWSSQTADEILSSPAVADGRVYVGSIDNNLYAYSLDPGSAYVTIIRRPDPARLIPDDRLTPQVSKESPQAAQEEE